MQLELGNKIRTLRRRDGRTQEDLANALGVTAQAVSRWESGGSYPDMSLIPSIAHYFGISIDELFGYENQREQKIDQLAERINEMRRQNNGVDRNLAECIALARNALVEFPGNEKLMIALAATLTTAGYARYGECHLINEEGYGVYDTEKHKTYAEWQEAVSLYEKALDTLQNGALRNHAIDDLSQLYLNLGDHEKAMELANSAPGLWSCREFLHAYAYDGKQYVKSHSETLLTTLRACAVFIVNITTADQRHLSAKEKADCLSGAIGLFQLVCSDENYGYHHGYIASLKMLLSLYLWVDGRKDEAFDVLEQATKHGKKMVDLCEKGVTHYTAPLVRLAEEKAPCTAEDARADLQSMPEDWPWWSVPEVDQVKEEMQKDPRWKIWVSHINRP